MQNLTKAQKHVLRLIFEHKNSEDEALEKAKIAKRIYDGWFRQKLWLNEYEENLKSCQRRADLIISSYKETAAVKLVTLTDCEKEAVARQACLDVLNMEIAEHESIGIEPKKTLNPEMREAIMGIIVKENDEKQAAPSCG